MFEVTSSEFTNNDFVQKPLSGSIDIFIVEPFVTL